MNQTQRIEEQETESSDRARVAVSTIQSLLRMGLDDSTFRARVDYLLNRPAAPLEMQPWLLK